MTIEKLTAADSFQIRALKGHDLVIDSNLNVFGLWYGMSLGEVRAGLGRLFGGCGMIDLKEANQSLK